MDLYYQEYNFNNNKQAVVQGTTNPAPAANDSDLLTPLSYGR